MEEGQGPKKIPTQKRSQETVNSILEATQKIISESGIEAFNTNLVAKIAGVSIGSLYQYFPNKDSIFVSFILSRTSKDLEKFRTLMSETAHESSDQLMRAVVDYLIDLSKSRSSFQRTILENLPSKMRLDIQLKTLGDLDQILKENLEGRQGRPLEEKQRVALFVLTRSLPAMLAFASIEEPALLDSSILKDQLEGMLKLNFPEFFAV